MPHFNFARRQDPHEQQPQEEVQPQAAESHEGGKEELRNQLIELQNTSADLGRAFDALMSKEKVNFRDFTKFILSQRVRDEEMNTNRRIDMPGLDSSDSWKEFIRKRANTDYALAARALGGLDKNFDSMDEEELEKRMDMVQTRFDRIQTNVEYISAYFSQFEDNNEEEDIDEYEVLDEDMIEVLEYTNPEDVKTMIKDTLSGMKEDAAFLKDPAKVKILKGIVTDEQLTFFKQEVRRFMPQYKKVMGHYKVYTELQYTTPQQDEYIISALNELRVEMETAHEHIRNYKELAEMETVVGELSEMDKQRENFEAIGEQYEQERKKTEALLSSDKVRFEIFMSGDKELKNIYDENWKPNMDIIANNFAYQGYLDTKYKLASLSSMPEGDMSEGQMNELGMEMSDKIHIMETVAIPKLKRLQNLIRQSADSHTSFMQELRMSSAIARGDYLELTDVVEDDNKEQQDIAV